MRNGKLYSFDVSIIWFRACRWSDFCRIAFLDPACSFNSSHICVTNMDQMRIAFLVVTIFMAVTCHTLLCLVVCHAICLLSVVWYIYNCYQFTFL